MSQTPNIANSASRSPGISADAQFNDRTPDMDASARLAEMVKQANQTSDFLKSLTNPARLLILCRLAEGPTNVSDLEAFLQSPQAFVSKQLARLRADRLVQATRNGRTITYELADERVERLVNALYELFCTTDQK